MSTLSANSQAKPGMNKEEACVVRKNRHGRTGGEAVQSERDCASQGEEEWRWRDRGQNLFVLKPLQKIRGARSNNWRIHKVCNEYEARLRCA